MQWPEFTVGDILSYVLKLWGWVAKFKWMKCFNFFAFLQWFRPKQSENFVPAINLSVWEDRNKFGPPYWIVPKWSKVAAKVSSLYKYWNQIIYHFSSWLCYVIRRWRLRLLFLPWTSRWIHQLWQGMKNLHFSTRILKAIWLWNFLLASVQG